MIALWRVLKNIATILRVLTAVKGVITAVAKSERRIPSCADTKILLDQVRLLLDKKVIDLPDFDEEELSSAILELENNMVCSVEQAHRNIARYGDVKNRIGEKA